MPGLPLIALIATFFCYLFGAICGAALARREAAARIVSFGAGMCGGLCGISSALLFFWKPDETVFAEILPGPLPFVQFTVRVDGLGAFFLLLVSTLAVAVSIYSIGYARMFEGRKSVGILALFFNLLLLATTLVFVAANAFFFLFAWELMALTAFCLVIFEHEDKGTRKAGVLFFVMSHIGTGCIIAGFLLLVSHVRAFGFTDFHTAAQSLPANTRNLSFILFLIGFGVKAGIVPLHVWLPAAHPVAPSNVSALMSGVLIKAGIYGITRVCFEFLGPPPMWWGVVILVVGTVSALLGVLYALMEHDLKRLLAYHSIENIGIILMGLGAALCFMHTGHSGLAALALVAGLYHTLNHAVFKGLLFLGAGAVLHSTHTRNMEELGGLIKRMPQTAFFFLVGAVAISALPPLNGFVSEWLTYQSLVAGFSTTTSLARLLFPLSGALLALTGALAAACFVKAFGISFLGQARSEHAKSAHDASATMKIGMGLLAGVCVFLGLFPNQFIKVFDPITAQFTGVAITQQIAGAGGWALTGATSGSGFVSTTGILLMAICLLPVPIALKFALGRKTRKGIGPTWDCGLVGLKPEMQYSATGFSKPLRMIFRGLFRPHRAVQTEFEFSRYFATTIRFESHIEETFEQRVYRPLLRQIVRTSRRMRALQAGSLQAYLIYIFVTLLVLLLITL